MVLTSQTSHQEARPTSREASREASRKASRKASRQAPRSSHVWRHARTPLVSGAVLLLGTLGCKDLVGSSVLPAGVSDPNVVKTPAGAVALEVGAHGKFQSALAAYVPVSGLLTDELQAFQRGQTPLNGALPDQDVQVDARMLSQADDWSPGSQVPSSDGVYHRLQGARAVASEAIGALAAYAPDSVKWRAHAYVLNGYSEIYLADFYCSGVPLSTYDFDGDYTYRAGSPTTGVYQHAVALFDTALSLAASDSIVMNLARVGKGRALLQLGQWSAAAAAVANVPRDFVYADTLPTLTLGSTTDPGAFVVSGFDIYNKSVSDREGISGLPYISSGDPRTSVVGVVSGGVTRYRPKKYPVSGVGNKAIVPVASGLEAQLITAEAALHANQSTWLSILNTLRQDSASTSALPAIVDPGTADARIDTLFAERAAWLFVTGQRQGDLRRLVQQYGRDGVQVYPHGAYPGLGGYGDFIDASIPRGELANPYFKGCLNRA
jgi:hypothetical protein